MLMLLSIDKIVRAPRALALPHIRVPSQTGNRRTDKCAHREKKAAREWTQAYLSCLVGLVVHRIASVSDVTQCGPPASGLRDPELSPFHSKPNLSSLAGTVFWRTGTVFWWQGTVLAMRQNRVCSTSKTVAPQVQYLRFPIRGK